MQHDAFASDHIALRGAMHDLLDSRDLLPSTSLGADVHCLLKAPGKLLSSYAVSTRFTTGFWAHLPLAIARYCVPSAENALMMRVALSCELLHSALDCFDEIEDDDSSEERDALGDGRFLNAATFLYTLVFSLFDDLRPRPLSTEQVTSLQGLLTTQLLLAMRGQHRDILAECADLSTFPSEECLSIAAIKSGGLFRLVCRMSAQAVNAPRTLVQLFAEVGELMGIVAQLENDVHGLEFELQEYEGETSKKSDVRRNKKTLPLVIAHKQLTALQQNAQRADTEEQREQEATMQAIAYKHGIIATLGAAAQLRERARVLVGHIEQVQGKLPETLRILFNLEDYR